MPPSITSTHDESEFTIIQIIKTKTRLTSKLKKVLDIKSINSLEDLKSLKRQDPFMYYSIPAVHSAKILMKDDVDIDTSNLGVSKIIRKYVSCPSRMRTTNRRRVSDSSGRSPVKKKRKKKNVHHQSKKLPEV